MHLAHRPAEKGEKLVSRKAGSTTGFFAPEDTRCTKAVCVIPGTELSFEQNVKRCRTVFDPVSFKQIKHKTAIFRQVNKDVVCTHHDTLEFPDGTQLLLNQLVEGQTATVLQIPPKPKTNAEKEEQRRAEFV
jgi:hypothetical protein